MIDLPSSTRVGKPVPKAAFLRAVPFSPASRKAFERAVESLVVLHSLTGRSLNLPDAPPAAEIIVLRIALRAPLPPRCVEDVARQNPHRILFLLAEGGSLRPAVFAGGALRLGEASPEASPLALRFAGLSLDAVWAGLVEQIVPLPPSALPLDERLARHDRRESLLREFSREDRLARAQTEPRRKLEHHERTLFIKRQLEELDHG